MGCTYSEEVDTCGLKAVQAIPVLVDFQDPAVVGIPLPLDCPFERLYGEMCLEVHPVLWYGERAKSQYICSTDVQGNPMGEFEPQSDESSFIIYPITAKTLESTSFGLTFVNSNDDKVGVGCFDLPTSNLEVTIDKITRTVDIRNGTGSSESVGRVALTITITPHAVGDETVAAPSGQVCWRLCHCALVMTTMRNGGSKCNGPRG